MGNLFFDFETQSCCDLKACGARVYAQHPSTRVLCMAYAIDDGPVQVWKPVLFGGVEDFPFDLFIDHDPWAWNALFDDGILEHTLGFHPDDRQPTHCAMSFATLFGAPSGLDAAIHFMGCCAASTMRLDNAVTAPIGKNKRGYQLMMRLCRGEIRSECEPYYIYPNVSNAELDELASYCAQDVESLRAAFLWCRSFGWNKREMGTYWMTQRMNQRGIKMDTELAINAANILSDNAPAISRELIRLTDGLVQKPTQVARILEFCGKCGVMLDNLRKDALESLLSDDRVELPPVVERVLSLRLMSNKISVTKLKTILQRSVEGRIYNEFNYRGARATGRWSSWGVQLQNIRRDVIADPETALKLIRDGNVALLEDMYSTTAADCVSKALRLMIIADEGTELYWGDLKSIEAYIVRWIGGDTRALNAIQAGADLYEITAARVLGIDVMTPEARQLGKIMDLALGFGGGASVLASTAKTYGVSLSEDSVYNYVNRWRTEHSHIVNTWKLFQYAFRTCLQRKQDTPVQNGYGYLWDGHRNIIHLRLPTGGTVPYPMACFDEDARLCYVSIKGGKPVYTSLYDAKLFQHAVQATARECLAERALQLEDSEFYPVALIHDEPITESTPGRIDEFSQIMKLPFDWAPGLPIGATCGHGQRYTGK